MSCGKVVVSTDVGGVREALEGCGMLVGSRHPQELARTVLKLLGDKRTRDSLESNALKKIEEKFSLEHSIDEYRNLYSELAARKPGAQ
jgi:glycosyltransferase involved in cell wall biosynthesis